MKKSKKPEIEIKRDVWYGTKTPCWLISYNENFGDYYGCGRGCDTLKEAFDELEKECRRRGYEIEDCVWSRLTDYTLKDRTDGVICDRKGQMLFNF